MRDEMVQLMAKEVQAAKVGLELKVFANASLVLDQSSLPKATQELVSLRASQINGCGPCVDMHTKEAAAAGEPAFHAGLEMPGVLLAVGFTARG